MSNIWLYYCSKNLCYIVFYLYFILYYLYQLNNTRTLNYTVVLYTHIHTYTKLTLSTFNLHSTLSPLIKRYNRYLTQFTLYYITYNYILYNINLLHFYIVLPIYKHTCNTKIPLNVKSKRHRFIIIKIRWLKQYRQYRQFPLDGTAYLRPWGM